MSNVQSAVPGQQNITNGGQANVLSVHKSFLKHGHFDILPYGLNYAQTPLYHVKLSKTSKPHITLWKNNIEVYTARLHSFSSKIDVFTHGQPMTLSESNLSGNITIHHPQQGDLKWKISQLSGTSAELIDPRGMKLAAIKSNHMPGMGEKKIELMVQFDPMFLDMVLGSAMTVMMQMKALSEAMGEIAGAAVDAGGAGA